MAMKTTPHTATAIHSATSPKASTTGRLSTRPKVIEATENMPMGKTIDHRVGVYFKGILCTKCRHTPAPMSTGISHRQKLQNTAMVLSMSARVASTIGLDRSEEHTSELQSRFDLVCRLLLEKKNTN